MLRNAGPVLIDEAHGFRNNSQRRRVLLNLLKGAKRHKVILLSATPQNLAPLDILRQLELFLDPIRHGLPGIRDNLNNYFPGDAARAEPQQIARVLQNVLIRRRRQDILRHYPDSTLNGRPIQFPDPKLSNREYSLDHAYRKAGGIEKIIKLLTEYQASRYKPAEYLYEDKKELPQYRNIVQSERGNLAGIMTTNLWKRLESSIPAFQSTLNTLINSNREFRDQILNGGVSQDDGALDSEEALTIDLPHDEEMDLDELDQEEDYITIREQSYPLEDFDGRRWLDDLDKDHQILSAIADSLQGIQPQDDAKLHEIKSFIKSPGVAGAKVLIFTESKVTAQYLHHELREDNPGVNIDLLMGGDSRSAEKVAKFSPKSNDRPNMPEKDQTRILIATDVIAEGQNLQDCNRVFSYDIHWNPVTLIQRYGRVDRITTEHTEVHLHNMMPDPEVESTIGVRQRVRNRVQAFHDLIGLDNVILENGEHVNPDSIYGIYEGEMPQEQDDISESLAVAQFANALLNRIRREQPDLWTELWLMPDGLRAAMTQEGHLYSGSTITLLTNGDTKQAYAVNSAGQVNELSHTQLVREVECAPDTPTQPLPPDTNYRVTTAVAALAEQMAPQPVALEPRRRDNQTTRYIRTQIAEARQASSNDPERLRQLETIRRSFDQDLPYSVNERVRALRRDGIEGDEFISALIAMRSDLPATAAPDQLDEPQRRLTTLTRIVCSMGVVE